jgi:DNA-binding NtrC family response regulator
MRVLVVDDDPAICKRISDLLGAWDFSVQTAADGCEALQAVDVFRPHIMITDLVMPRMDGFELMKTLVAEGYDCPVIVLTGFGNIDVALKVIHQLGAFWFLEKPVPAEALYLLIGRLAVQVRLAEDAERLRRQLAYRGMLADLVGSSSEMQLVYSLLQQVAPSKVPVLISGESGTGKELAARAVHQLSPRARGPFVAINCAALPTELIESELFGHEKGAFTGALERRAGCFERADGGTLLLDELAEMPLNLQAKLLRVIEDSRVRPLGGSGDFPVNVRIIASTNRPIEQALKGGELRSDLFYRLSVFHVSMPALRDRRSDLPELVEALVENLNRRHSCQVTGVEDKVMRLFQEYRWPGNVRELRNVLERAMILAQSGQIQASNLPGDFGRPAGKQAAPSANEAYIRLTVGTTLSELQKSLIHLTLSEAANDKSRAARILGISRKTMFNRLKEYRTGRAHHVSA